MLFLPFLLQMDSPVMKFELKPYVYSRAMAKDMSKLQRPVNQRPIFHTMQPVMISHGAKVHQVSPGRGLAGSSSL